MHPFPLKVALVDDDQGVLQSWRHALDGAQIQCAGAFSDPRAAVGEIPGLCPAVILMDLRMPGFSGIDCTHRLLQIQPRLRIMMVTAVASVQAVRESFSVGAGGYLTKPVGPDQLGASIQLMLHGATPMSNDMVEALIRSGAPLPGPCLPAPRLTGREWDILQEIARGRTDKEISSILGMSLNTLRWHSKRVFSKLGVHNRTEAALRSLALARPDILPQRGRPRSTSLSPP